jgi:uncharacterized repeat protein (TIGR01451 family)
MKRNLLMSIRVSLALVIALMWFPSTPQLAQALTCDESGCDEPVLASPQMAQAVFSETEPNQTPAEFDAFGCGDVATGAINPVGDRDVWSMTGNAGEFIFAVADAAEATPSDDTFLTVLANDTITVITSNDNSGYGNASAVAGITVPLSGRVYFAVDESGANSTISRYELHAAIIPSTNFANEVEPNANYTQSTNISAAYMKGSMPAGDVFDFFKFPANSGDRIVVIMDDDPDKNGNRFDSNLRLLAPDGVSALADGDNNSAAQANATTPITAATTGTYYVRISDGGAGGTDKAYRLVVLVNGRPIAGDACFAKLRIVHTSAIDGNGSGVFTTTLENIGNVRGPARMVGQFPLGVTVQSCSFSVSNGGGSITLFGCETGANGKTGEYGTDSLRPGGSVRAKVTVKPLNPLVLSRSPYSQTVLFGGTANFTVSITNTGQLTLTELYLNDALLNGCSRASPFETGYAFNSLPPAQSVSYACNQPNVIAQIESTLTLSSPVLLRNFIAGFMVGPNGELDQESSSATLVMPDNTALAFSRILVRVFRSWLPMAVR